MARTRQATSDDFLAIRGDAIVEDVRINAKGGSRAAILRKKVIAEWGPDVTMVNGARLDFGRHISGVFLAPQLAEGLSGAHRRIEVTRVSDTRFVLDLCSDSDQPVGELEGAFLQMLIHQFKAGERRLIGEEEAMTRLGALSETSVDDD